MKQQFIHMTPEPDKSQGVSTKQPVDAQNAFAPQHNSLFKAPFAQNAPTPIGDANQSFYRQSNGQLASPSFPLAPVTPPQQVPGPLFATPPQNEPYGNGRANVTYGPVSSVQHFSLPQPPFQTPMAADFSMPAPSAGFFPAPPGFAPAPQAFASAPRGFAPAPPGFAPAPPGFAPAPPGFAPAPPGFASAPRGFAPAPPGFSSPARVQSWPAQPSYPEQGRAPQWPQNLPITSPQNTTWQNMPAGPAPSPRGASMRYGPGPQTGYAQHTPPPMARPTQLKAAKKRGLPIWSRVLIGTLVLLLTLGGSAYAYYQVNYAKSISNITNQQVIHHNAKGQVVVATPANTDVLTGNRLNILLLGSDTDGKSLPLAQTDIIITIDPQTKYVGMLSIPRDLRLYAPKAGAIKLDEAFATGWALPGTNNYGNAVGLSIDTIEQNFGIPINYSAWVGLDGFVQVINTAGGVDVDVLHPMVDDIYPNDVNNQGGQAYDYKRLYIAPGPQHLDGIHALEYVRTRHSDGQADFGRSVRQQQVLSQLKTKLTQIDLNQLPQLVQDLNGHVKTDIQLTDIPKLVNFARSIDLNKINQLVLSQPYSVPASAVFPKDTSTDYIPVCSQILPKIQQMFDLGNKATCPTVGARYSFPSTALSPTAPSPLAVAHTNQAKQSVITTTEAWQMLGATAPTNAMSLSSPMTQATSSVHSLLDLMLMTVFQSFGAVTT